MWKASKVSKTFFNNLQLETGVLLKRFDISNPVEPKDEDIITATTGGISLSCVARLIDLFEDIDNVKTGTKQGQHVEGWDVEMTTTGLELTEETISTALGASETNMEGGIVPRECKPEDFKDLFWLSDTADTTKAFLAVCKNAFSTGGFTLTASKNTKGNMPLTFKGFYDLENQEEEPAEFYILEKVGEE